MKTGKLPKIKLEYPSLVPYSGLGYLVGPIFDEPPIDEKTETPRRVTCPINFEKNRAWALEIAGRTALIVPTMS